MFGIIADIWSHGQELSLAILCSFPSWTGSLQRYGDKPPSDWGRLVPPLMVAQHLLSCHLHLCICPGQHRPKTFLVLLACVKQVSSAAGSLWLFLFQVSALFCRTLASSSSQSCRSHIHHFHRPAHVPADGGLHSQWFQSPTARDLSWVNPQTMNPLFPVQKHTTTR